MRLFLSSTLLLFSCFSVLAQWSSDYFNLQKNFPKVNQAITNRLDSLQLECAQKQIGWPIQQIYLRSFKENNLIEVWVKDDLQKQYKFLKFLTVCSKNGKLGPKRKEGDKQVPEGFYIVDRFNPNSNYHLSLGISYPNVSDRILSDAVKPGGDIYIHGDCVSVGCLAINDIQIEDLYVLSVVAKASGQEFIPVHIFPGRFNDKKSKPAIDKMIVENKEYLPFLQSMKAVYYFFEKERQLPAILVNNKGNYIIEDVDIPSPEITVSNNAPVLKNKNYKVRKYSATELSNTADSLPVFEGGNDKFFKFVKDLNKELASYLSASQKKAFVYVDYIINTDGTLTNVDIKKGGNEALNDVLITKMENTLNWKPAKKNNTIVAYKMSQTFFVEQ